MAGGLRRQSHRPASVTILVVGVLMLSVFQLVRLSQAFQYWDFVASYSAHLGYYFIVSSLLWLLAWLAVFLGLWRWMPWAPALTRWVSFLYVVNEWIDRLFIENQASRDANDGFILIVHVLFLLLVFWIVGRNKPRFYWR